MSSSVGTALQMFSGTSERGNLAEAFNLAIAAAKEGLQTDLILYELKKIEGLNGGNALKNVITVSIEAQVGPPSKKDLPAIRSPLYSLSNHEKITFEVGKDYVAYGAISRLGLWWIIKSNLEMDAFQGSNEVHFDNCQFRESIEQIEDKWNTINHRGNPRSIISRTAFGQLLHTLQDFYSHSTWVEIHLGMSPIPVWNLQYNALPSGIVSGTWRLGRNRCPSGTPHHDDLNKDSESSPQGSKEVTTGPNMGMKLFDLSKDVAIRATRAQFEKFFGFAVPRATVHVEPFSFKDFKEIIENISDHTRERFQAEHVELDVTFTTDSCGCRKW